MSGGSYDYAYRHVRDMADALESLSTKDTLRLAFVAHLRLVAEAMKAVEWVDSADTSPGDEYAAIRRVITPFDERAAGYVIYRGSEARRLTSSPAEKQGYDRSLMMFAHQVVALMEQRIAHLESVVNRDAEWRTREITRSAALEAELAAFRALALEAPPIAHLSPEGRTEWGGPSAEFLDTAGKALELVARLAELARPATYEAAR